MTVLAIRNLPRVTAKDSKSLIASNGNLEQLHARVAEARARLAELETAYTVEKSKVDALQARLFARLRPYYQERDKLRLIISYREEFLEVVLRNDEEQAKGVERKFQEAKSQSEREYEETATKLAAKKALTDEEAVEVGKLWKSLVKLYHPDRFLTEPEKLETYGKLTAAINRAKDSGDLKTLRQIAYDPHGFILRNGWVSLDFREEEQASHLRKLLKSLELEIVGVLEATNRLHTSAEFELRALVAKNPELLNRIATKHGKLLEEEIANLRAQADQLAKRIEELTGKPVPG